MAKTKFVPLTPGLIDEGQLASDMATEFAELQRVIVEFARTHGPLAAKAKAELCLKIELSIDKVNTDDPIQSAFGVKASISIKQPRRPATVSIAMAGEQQDGELCLFVRRSGSSDDHPLQGRLATKDGRTITEDGDPEDQ